MSEPNANPKQIHLVLERAELAIVVSALRSAGRIQLAVRLEAILRQTGPAQDHRWQT